MVIIFALTIIPLLSYNAFAESIYDINIPSGSADKTAPFHWISEKDGDTSGFIEIIVNDSIQWKNGDTVTHTVISGTPQKGPDQIFDSGRLGPGQTFVHKFTETGKFPYYCTIHPWREGLVDVVSGYSILPNVASDIGDGMKTFDIEYKFNRLVNRASIDESSKSILFELKGRTISDENTLTMLLPSTLITGISSVSVDGVMTENFTQELEEDITKFTITEISPTAKSITIIGATIIPEFAEIVFVILTISIAGTIIASKKKLVSRNIQFN